MRIALIFFSGCAAVCAQFVSFGVKTGVVLKDATPQQSIFSAASDANLTGGPTIEFHLRKGFSIEVDALFRGYSQTGFFAIPTFIGAGEGTGTAFGGGVYSTHARIKSQEFPLLLKYRFLNGPIRPFVTGGISLARQSEHFESVFTCFGTSASCTSTGGLSNSTSYNVGPVAGLGVDFKAGRIHIDPEVRYTRRSNPTTNQISALIGFTF